VIVETTAGLPGHKFLKVTCLRPNIHAHPIVLSYLHHQSGWC